MYGPSPFIDIAAVEAWDAWFRWRECGRLRDIAVEATWRRTARPLALADSAQSAPAHKVILMAAFASWCPLIDERIIATAGTGAAARPNDNLVAALNVAMLVRDRRSARARFDLVAFGAMTELAVKALNNAVLLGRGTSPRTSRLRIDIIELADALVLLDLRYDSVEGCAQAGRIGRTLAEGCFRGAIRSAQEGGSCAEPANQMLEWAVRRRFSAGLMNDARRHGLRHESLTAITSQLPLALFANNVANALDPLTGENDVHLIAIPEPEHARSVRSSGYALTLRRAQAGDATTLHAPAETIANVTASAQIAMHRVIQPWIDEPIRYALPGVYATAAMAYQKTPHPSLVGGGESASSTDDTSLRPGARRS